MFASGRISSLGDSVLRTLLAVALELGTLLACMMPSRRSVLPVPRWWFSMQQFWLRWFSVDLGRATNVVTCGPRQRKT